MTDGNFILKDLIKENIQQHLANAAHSQTHNMYEFILEQVEEPLLQFLMQKAKNNQCKVTRWLGLSRGTVRKMLKKYGMIE